eukprot:COSAG05_NODE_1021_length_6146_cov_2.729949_5_plen_116_part_00
MAQRVYFFSPEESEADMSFRDLLGGKGANLAEMCARQTIEHFCAAPRAMLTFNCSPQEQNWTPSASWVYHHLRAVHRVPKVRTAMRRAQTLAETSAVLAGTAICHLASWMTSSRR